MSYLTDNPDLMLEIIAVLVRRAGGAVAVSPNEGPGPFRLLHKRDAEGVMHLSLDENISEDEVRQIIAADEITIQ